MSHRNRNRAARWFRPDRLQVPPPTGRWRCPHCKFAAVDDRSTRASRNILAHIASHPGVYETLMKKISADRAGSAAGVGA